MSGLLYGIFKTGINRVWKFLVTSVFLQTSMSDQQPSSMALPSGQEGFTSTAERDDTTTTLLTLASEHALSTFTVPATAGASSSACNNRHGSEYAWSQGL